MTKNEIIMHYGIKSNDIPKFDVMVPKFNSNYGINIENFDKLFRNIVNKRRGGCFRDIIIDEFKTQNNIDIIPSKIEQEIKKPILNSIQYSFNNNSQISGFNYIIPGIFWNKSEPKYCIKYHMLINVAYKNRFTKFVVVLDRNDINRQYNIHKIITYNMGICNIRYVYDVLYIYIYIQIYIKLI